VRTVYSLELPERMPRSHVTHLSAVVEIHGLTNNISPGRRRETAKERRERVEEKRRLEEMKAKVSVSPSLP